MVDKPKILCYTISTIKGETKMKIEFVKMFLKDNQPSLHNAIERCYKGEAKAEAYETFGKEFKKDIKKYIKKVLTK